MGAKMEEDDTQIPALFAVMNERFAPSKKDYPKDKKTNKIIWIDGIKEMVRLQEKFDIFRIGTGDKNDPNPPPTFKECAALLNLGGPMSWSLRKRWFDYLDWLDSHCTTEDGTKGGVAICNMLRKNLRRELREPQDLNESPKPVFFMPYLYGVEPRKEPKVLINITKPGQKPLFYIDEYYWVIELPMQPYKKPPKPK